MLITSCCANVSRVELVGRRAVRFRNMERNATILKMYQRTDRATSPTLHIIVRAQGRGSDRIYRKEYKNAMLTSPSTRHEEHMSNHDLDSAAAASNVPHLSRERQTQTACMMMPEPLVRYRVMAE